MQDDEFCLDPTRMTLVWDRRLRWHAIPGVGKPLQYPAQQDVAELRPSAIKHQQHPQRRRPLDPRSGEISSEIERRLAQGGSKSGRHSMHG